MCVQHMYICVQHLCMCMWVCAAHLYVMCVKHMYIFLSVCSTCVFVCSTCVCSYVDAAHVYVCSAHVYVYMHVYVHMCLCLCFVFVIFLTHFPESIHTHYSVLSVIQLAVLGVHTLLLMFCFILQKRTLNDHSFD